MAVRFEPTCDDKGQWHVGAAGNLYSDSGQNSRSLSISSPLDLRYSETSDYEDRRTSSCSPDSCDLSIQEKLHYHPASVACDRSFSLSPHKEMDNRETYSLTPEWKSQSVCLPEKIRSGDIFPRMKRAKANSNFEESNQNKIGDFQKPNMIFQRKYPADSVFPRVHDVSCDKAEFARTSSTFQQNGGTVRKTVFTSRRAYSKCDFDHFNTSSNAMEDVKTTAVGDSRPKTTVKSAGVNKKLECFGETDAAEALLGLSEGFYQPVQSNASASSKRVDDKALHDNSVELPDKDLAANNSSDIVSANNGAKASTDLPKTCIASTAVITENNASAKHSRFHFKKVFCQKFVNSVRPGAGKVLENVVSEKYAPSKHNNASLRNRVTAQDGGVDCTRNDPSVRPHTQHTKLNERKEVTSNPDNVPLTKTKKIQPAKEISDKSNHGNEFVKRITETHKKPSGICKDDDKVSSDIGAAFESKKSTTNLYRISTSLGSSNESLAAANEDINDEELASESSSESSTAESDDETNSAVLISEKPLWKESDWSSAAAKRKSFVLHRPKFSLPSWDKSIKPHNDESTSCLNRTDDSSQTPNFNKNSTHSEAGSESTTSSSVQNPLVFFANAADSDIEPNKQTSSHIKKATFTFNGAGKHVKVTQQGGLNVTSQAAAEVARTQCAEKDKNCFRFDRDKLDRSEAVKAKQATSQNDSLTKDRETFGVFRKGDSFENLSKPSCIKTDFSDIKNQTDTKHNAENLPYDKARLPRPSARSADLEARQLMKSKAVRKRKLSTLRDKGKESPRLLEKPLKRSKHNVDSTKKAKSRQNKKQVATAKSDQEKSKQQNGVGAVETSPVSTQLSLERSSSRRKPSRVYKHQKYTSVSMMSTNQNPRISSEFAIISKPLNLDHRVLLANSIDLYRGSPDNLSIDSNVSSPLTSSTCSSSTSSVAGDDNDVDINKTDDAHAAKSKDRLKRHRYLSAIETNAKPDILRRKQKMKRLLSMSEQGSRKTPVRLMTSNVLANNWQRGVPKKGELTSFRLLSLFPAPASLRAGYANGELLPGYGPSVSGQRSSLPLRWNKGSDVSDLKQKRQREKWRSMTLDMFCMGAKS